MNTFDTRPILTFTHLPRRHSCPPVVVSSTGGNALREPGPGVREPDDGIGRRTLTECPECGAALLHTTGCVLCGQCGYSPCD